MSTVWLVVMFLLNAVAMPLVVELVKERAPGLAARLIRLAVCVLPQRHRERYLAEWLAELEEMERENISQLLASMRILASAPAIGSVLRTAERTASGARWTERFADQVERITHRLTPLSGRRYREYLRSMLRRADDDGLVTTGFYRPDLDEIFVDVTLATLPGTPVRRHIREFLDHRRPSVITMIGAPGTGKTRLLQLTALELCRRRRGRRRTVPILLYLREHASGIAAEPSIAMSELLHRATNRYAQIAPVRWVERRLRSGDCVVMLDGLDEVEQLTDVNVIADWINRQAERYPRNDFVITSRPHGYHASGLRPATVLQTCDFTDDQAFAFIHRWYLALERQIHPTGCEERARLAADDLCRRLSSAPALAALTANPLLLTMIANVHRYRATLPGSRADLYEEIFEVALWRRQDTKRLIVSLPGDTKGAVLRHLALMMMQRGTRTLTRDEVVADLKLTLRHLSYIAPVDRLLTDITTTDLLVEREDGLYAFSHFAFQEHLAAQYIREKGLTHILADNVDNPWWRETTLLFSSRGNADEIMKACLSAGSKTAMFLAYALADEANDLDPELRKGLPD